MSMDAGLVGHWKFNEKFGIIANDSSRYRNTGTLTGATHLPVWAEKGIKFDGVDDYVDAGNNASLDITSAVTIGAWINPTVSGSSVYRAILAKRSLTSTNYELYLKNDAGVNQGRLSWYSGLEVPSSFIPVTGSWTHVVATVSGNNLIIYANGVSVLNTTIAEILTNTGILAIGQTGSIAFEHFKGSIDEVRIYNRALSTSEIKRNYEATKHNYI